MFLLSDSHDIIDLNFLCHRELSSVDIDNA